MADYPRPLYRVLAQLVDARIRCDRNVDDPNATRVHDGDRDVTREHWGAMAGRHRDKINELVSRHMPSGSGWDSGTKLDHERSSPERLVFYGGFHHMDEHGYYDGWTEHTITVRPSLVCEIELTISGRNRNEIKEYLANLFNAALCAQVTA